MNLPWLGNKLLLQEPLPFRRSVTVLTIMDRSKVHLGHSRSLWQLILRSNARYDFSARGFLFFKKSKHHWRYSKFAWKPPFDSFCSTHCHQRWEWTRSAQIIYWEQPFRRRILSGLGQESLNSHIVGPGTWRQLVGTKRLYSIGSWKPQKRRAHN